ncbi:MAG: acetyl-CoA carboxylase biotin carboxyl carrier protein subunit [Candidatus Binatia bacterium]
MKTTLLSGSTDLTIEYTQSGNAYEAMINGQPLRARLLSLHDTAITIEVDGRPLHGHVVNDGPRTLVAFEGRVYTFTRPEEKKSQARQREAGRLDPNIRSPMPGKILEVRVTEGATVDAGQVLILLEAMKMENSLVAEGPALVKKIHVAPSELVDLGQLLVELEFAMSSPSTGSS